jgi:isopenicillin-N epimerase
LSSHWRLDPHLVYLNHGSFGACPSEVLAAQSRHRDRVEADAVRFFVCDIWDMTDRSRAALAPVLGCRERDLVLMNNATSAVATVLRNLELRAGDELLVNTHEYPACLAMFRDAARRAGATVVEAPIPWPVPSADAVAEAILSRATARTRLCLLSLVTSPTALVMPAERIVRELRARGVETLLDAAHGPGFLPMDLDGIGAAYATGNCHKWLCSPKGSAFLHVREDKQAGFRPLVLSVYAENLPRTAERTHRSAFNVEFDYCGTDDVSARLTIADAVAFMDNIVPGGLGGVMEKNRAMALRGRQIVCERLGIEPPVPEGMLGPLVTLGLPQHDPENCRRLAGCCSVYADSLQDRLLRRYGIQIPIWAVPCSEAGVGRTVRLSAQLYNSEEQYEYLAEALAEELAAERLGREG